MKISRLHKISPSLATRLHHAWQAAGHYVVSALLFLLLAVVAHVIADGERHYRSQELRNTALLQAAELASSLEAELSSNIFLATGLGSYVAAQRELDEVAIFRSMRQLASMGDHIRNIGIAPDNRLTYVYPYEGNEAAIGLYYPDVPEQWPDVQKAIENRETVLAGPLNLMQGGRGIVSRTPVFTEDGEYWGILSIVLDADSVFEAAGLKDDTQAFDVALRTAGPDAAQEVPFLGDASLFDNDPVAILISVPGGPWQLGLVPKAGWSPHSLLIDGLQVAATLLAAGIAALAFYFLRSRGQLATREKQISLILETSKECIILLGPDDRVIAANPAASRLLQVTREEMHGMELDDLVDFSVTPPDHKTETGIDRDAFFEEGDTYLAMAKSRERGNIPVNVSVGQAESNGCFFVICVLRDVSWLIEYEKQLVELATIDGLSGAFNRKSFMSLAERNIHLAKRHGRDLALLVIDADHFKHLNDAHGHAAGDAALSELGTLIRNMIRESDIFGRQGGEEFALLLPETDEANAVAVAEKLLQAVRSMRVTTPSGITVGLTVSIGVATVGGPVQSLADLLIAADKALYRAKDNGRDRLEVAGRDIQSTKQIAFGS